MEKEELPILEELDIDLTRSEKTTFFKFLFLYLGSSFVLLMIVAVLYFQKEKTLYYDLVKSNMENKASEISSKIIFAHMSNTLFNRGESLSDSEYKISFYDQNKKKLYGNLDDKIDFNRKIIHQGKNIILINDSTLGHLGVYYIAIKEDVLHKKIAQLYKDIFIVFIFIYFLISIFAYYLAKLFIKPLKNEREKLNNFIKDTTHELNTPISAIMMSTETENLTAKQIKRIKVSANKISEIYKDLTYVFLENEDKQKDIKEFDLKDLIEKLVENYEPIYTKKRIDVKLKLSSVKYKIDENDFERLFNNLFSNAIKYNVSNGTIEIELRNNSLIIKDTGIGISKDNINDIYKRYFRATKQNGGFGLGLNIVSSICNEYNIDIKVDSKQNSGTTFILNF